MASKTQVAAPTPVERLVKALELQIAYQEANPTESVEGKPYDPHRVPYFTKFMEKPWTLREEVKERLKLSEDALRLLIREATDAAVVADAWTKSPGRCLTLPQYVKASNGKVTRFKDDSPSLF